MKMKNYALAVVLVLYALVASAQLSKEAFQREKYASGGHAIDYRILYPENFDAKKRYPVVLFLHGAGERGDDNESQLVHGSQLFLKEHFRKSSPTVVIFPQCPKDSYWANVEIDRSSYPLKLSFKNGGEPTYPLSLVMDLMDSIQALYYSRDDQIYVGGLSMGGMGTFEIVSRMPDMFAGAFPICGGANPLVASQIVNVPLWVFHGAMDEVVLASYSTDMVIAIRNAGGDVKYTLYKDVNHNSWDSAFAEPDLLPWLLGNRKGK